jgi:4-amino-4-deoxy-L-arabinose transferase-like glycosyltransferase
MSARRPTTTTSAPEPGRLGFTPRRIAGILVAIQLIGLGLYPAPVILLRDPATANNPAVRQFFDELLFWIVGAVMIIAPVVAFANVFGNVFDETWADARDRLRRVRDRSFIAIVATAATVLAAAAAVFVFSRKPTSSDEIAQLWHAKILLSGRLSLPADPNPEFFGIDNVVDRGGWYSQFPIGGPVLMALASLLRATWLLNPVLVGLTVVNVYRFAARAYGEDVARFAAVLSALCPYLLIMSGSYMNHTMVVFFTTLALAELPRWIDGTGRQQTRAAVVIGLSLGAAMTVRPLDGAVATAVLASFLLYQAVVRRRVSSVVVAAVAGALPLAGLLLANQLTNDDPLRFGYDVIWGTNHSLGFHTDPLGSTHTPGRGLKSVMSALMQLNWSLFGWPVAGLIVVSAAVVAIRTLQRWEILLLAWIELHLIAYSAFWSEGHFLGPRYLFTIVPAFIILAARGIVAGVGGVSPRVRRSLIAGLGAAMLGAWVFPRPPFGPIGEARAARPLRAALKLDIDPVVQSLEGGKALIFVTEPASLRLARRLWGLGISRPDAIRLVSRKDNCALLDAVIEEAKQPGSPSERVARLENTKNYVPSRSKVFIAAPDPAFKISDMKSVTAKCWDEGMIDNTAGDAISYGPTLLRNEIGPDGRVAGPIVFVSDMIEHNEVLRSRFGDRPWYRLRLPSGTVDRVPRLIPYQAIATSSSPSKLPEARPVSP